MNVLSDEARDSYKEDIVFELQSSTTDDLEHNLETVVTWINKFQSNGGAYEDSAMES